MKIGPYCVGDGRTIVAAEIGINHNGDIDLAKKMALVSKQAGCQVVKLQKRSIPLVYHPEDLAKQRDVPRQFLEQAIEREVLPEEAVKRLQSSDFKDSINEDQKRMLELSEGEYREFDQYCREIGILWAASPWDMESLQFIDSFNPPFHKAASASLTDLDLLSAMKDTGKPVVISTGGATYEEIDQAVDVLDRDNLLICHCVATYPARTGDLNLLAVQTLADRYNLPIGYSGHEEGVATSVMAVVLGAVYVERHFTLNRAMYGSDQSASLEPRGLEIMVRDIRNWELSKGDGVKRVLPEEEEVLKKLRRRS